MLKEIVQEVHDLIGNPQDIQNLSEKKQARLLVISDSHGKTSLMKRIICQYGATCDALVFCGDGSGDLIQNIKDSRTDEKLAESLPPVIAFARGNGDSSTYPISRDFSISIPNTQILTVCGRNIMIVHGHREGVDFGMENLGLEMQISDCKTAFYGHTHIATQQKLNEYTFYNPGSCARPRGGQPASFAIATVEKHMVDLLYIKMITNADGTPGFQSWIPIF